MGNQGQEFSFHGIITPLLEPQGFRGVEYGFDYDMKAMNLSTAFER